MHIMLKSERRLWGYGIKKSAVTLSEKMIQAIPYTY